MGVQKLQERAAKVPEGLTDAKKAVAPHEKRALGSILLAEAKEQVGTLDAEIKKAKDACAPLVEAGGIDYLVSSSVKTLAKALQAHMGAKELSEDDLWKEAGQG